MDEQRIKAAFKEWLYRLASERHWLDEDGKIVQARLAEYFQISRQVVANWLNGTSFISSKMVAEVICPTLGTLPSEFWTEMQHIDAELRDEVIVSRDVLNTLRSSYRPPTSHELLQMLDSMPESERSAFREAFLMRLAKAG